MNFAELKALLEDGEIATSVTLKELTVFCEENFPDLEWLVRSNNHYTPETAFANLYDRFIPPNRIYPAYGPTPEQALAKSIAMAWNRRKENAQ